MKKYGWGAIRYSPTHFRDLGCRYCSQEETIPVNLPESFVFFFLPRLRSYVFDYVFCGFFLAAGNKTLLRISR